MIIECKDSRKILLQTSTFSTEYVQRGGDECSAKKERKKERKPNIYFRN